MSTGSKLAWRLLSGGRMKQPSTTRGSRVTGSYAALWLCVAAQSGACGGGAASSSEGLRQHGGTGAPAPISGPRYEVSLHRPNRVGDVQHEAFVVSERSDLYAARGTRRVRLRRELKRIHCSGTVTILAVDEKGLPIDRQFVAEDCLVAENGTERALLPRDAPVRITYRAWPNEPLIQLEGEELSEADAELLGGLYSGYTSGPTYDDYYGTTAARAVGEDWPINEDLVAQRWSSHGVALDPSMVIGRVKLAAAGACDQGQCMTVETNIRIAGLDLPANDMDLRTLDSLVTMEERLTYPQQSGLGPSRTTRMRIAAEVAGRGPRLEHMVLQVEFEKRTTHTVNSATLGE